MFSNTAYEAFYQYLGLSLHSKFIEVITSQKVFLGLIVMIFGFLFFLTTVQFFSRYMPGALVNRRHVPLSKYVRIVFLLFLGISILKVETSTGVKRFNGQSWHQNPYIHGQIRDVAPQYKVSFLFDLMSRTAEETSALISRVVDQLFETSHSQLDAPNFFFKAMMYGAAATIEDTDLKHTIHFYTDECFDRILPLIGDEAKQNKVDSFFSDSSEFDRKLSTLVIEIPDRTPYNCLDVKNDLRTHLRAYAVGKDGGMGRELDNHLKQWNPFNATGWENYRVSNFLVNHYLEEHEGALGLQKGSLLPQNSGRIYQYLSRLGTLDGWRSLLSNHKSDEGLGATLAASRSLEFNENLARAPHLAGFIKMLLIAVFPWLLFFVVAGHIRVLIYWFLSYLSVLLWTPIWTLLYHIMLGISLSSETLAAFGKLNDGISLYSAELISSRMYELFAVYAWLQVLTGTLFTGLVLWFLRPMLGDTEKDKMPDVVDDTTRAISTGARVVSAL
jgi:hypothetical protein